MFIRFFVISVALSFLSCNIQAGTSLCGLHICGHKDRKAHIVASVIAAIHRAKMDLEPELEEKVRDDMVKSLSEEVDKESLESILHGEVVLFEYSFNERGGEIKSCSHGMTGRKNPDEPIKVTQHKGRSYIIEGHARCPDF